MYHFHATVMCLYCCTVCIHIPQLGSLRNKSFKVSKRIYRQGMVVTCHISDFDTKVMRFAELFPFAYIFLVNKR